MVHQEASRGPCPNRHIGVESQVMGSYCGTETLIQRNTKTFRHSEVITQTTGSVNSNLPKSRA